MTRYAALAHANAEKAAVYRAVMRAFAEAKAYFVVHLRPEDVHARAPELGLDEIHAALDQLVAWGNLQAEPDTSRVTSVEEFYRKRFLYQITREGEAAEQAFATFEAELGRRGALQTVALEDIRTRLAALVELAAQAEPDPAQVALSLRDLSAVFTDLAENARAFMTGLGRTIELGKGDRDAFIAYKQRLIDYIERFIGDLVTASADVAARIEALDGHGDDAPPIARLLEIAAVREAADQVTDLEVAGELDEDARRREALGNWQGRWEGLKAWFLGSAGRPSQAMLLRRRARGAITELLEAYRRLNERRLGRSDRSADFRTLARWFMECGEDGDAHRVWRAAFGLTPARHLTVNYETLEAWAAEPVAASRPWAEAPPLTVSARLRATGSLARRGAPPKIERRDRERAYLATRLAEEADAAAAARAHLATGEWTRVSELGELDAPSFGLFLDLLGDALTRLASDERPVTATSGDGSLEIELAPPPVDTTARLRTPWGELEGRDYRLRITDLAGAPQ